MSALARAAIIGAALPLLLAADAPADPGQALAGRYYRQFQNALVSGEKYTGEDIVEIVPVSRGAAYVRMRLSFYNGHSCSIYGVARAERDALVYQSRARWLSTPCLLKVQRSGQDLLIDDGADSCRSYCGARGSFNDVRLPYASKRPIRYMERLKASREYRDALTERRTGKPVQP